MIPSSSWDTCPISSYVIKSKSTAVIAMSTAILIVSVGLCCSRLFCTRRSNFSIFELHGTNQYISGVVLSRYRFSFLPFGNGLSFARNMHMLSAYWGFVFMSLHLGFHWNMMMGMARTASDSISVLVQFSDYAKCIMSYCRKQSQHRYVVQKELYYRFLKIKKCKLILNQ